MSRETLLRFALIAFGVIFCLVYPLAVVWPSGWAWHEGSPASSHYFMMIVGIYATLGVYLDPRIVEPGRAPFTHLIYDRFERRTRRHHGSSVA